MSNTCHQPQRLLHLEECHADGTREQRSTVGAAGGGVSGGLNAAVNGKFEEIPQQVFTGVVWGGLSGADLGGVFYAAAPIIKGFFAQPEPGVPADVTQPLSLEVRAMQAEQAAVEQASTPTTANDVVGPGSLLEEEAAQIQAIAEKHQTRIDIGGSRAAGNGRNIERVDLPPDKGPGTRSDIDFIVDPEHPQFQQIMAELREVGNGAGSLHPDYRFLWKYDIGDVRIRFEPGVKPRRTEG